MMALRRRHQPPASGDTTEALQWRTISSALPVIVAGWMPGLWIGNACDLAGVEYGGEADDAEVEQLVAESGGAFDLVFAEPIPLIRELLVDSRDRDERWFASMFKHVETWLPGAVQQALAATGEPTGSFDHVSVVGAVYMHPISACFPFDGDRYHAHVVVPGRIYCNDPSCTTHH